MSESDNLPRTFGGLDDADSRYDTARVLIWPVPVEETVSYGAGTKQGPDGIIDASRHMELYDDELAGEIFRIGIHTLAPFAAAGQLAGMMTQLYEETRRLLEAGKFVCALGGEHSITGPLVRAHVEKYPGLSVLQIDAHADLRNAYDGTPHSHAAVMRRVVELCPAVQVGIRSLSAEEARVMPTLPVHTFFARDIVGRTDWVDAVLDRLSDTVYLTVDVDGFDPSLIPTTGTPEPGGLSWYEVVTLIRRVAERKRIVGMDVVELSVQAENSAPSFVIAKLIYKTLGYVFRGAIPPL